MACSATVDTIPLDATKPRTLFRTPRFSLYRFGIPDANWYDRDTYAGELARTGFVDGQVTSIREHSWEPWFRHWSRLATEPAALATWPPRSPRRSVKEWRDREQIRRELDLLDYVLGVAVKPAVKPGPDRARI